MIQVFVKKEHLCFSCLLNYLVSSCRSANRCRQCQSKHHSSICNKHAKPFKLNSHAACCSVPATSDVITQPETTINFLFLQPSLDNSTTQDSHFSSMFW